MDLAVVFVGSPLAWSGRAVLGALLAGGCAGFFLGISVVMRELSAGDLARVLRRRAR